MYIHNTGSGKSVWMPLQVFKLSKIFLILIRVKNYTFGCVPKVMIFENGGLGVSLKDFLCKAPTWDTSL